MIAKLMLIVAVVCWAYNLGGLAAIGPRKPPIETLPSSAIQPTITGFLEALKNNQVELAYNNFTSAGFRKDTSLAQFKELVKKYGLAAQNHSFQIHSFYIEEGEATFAGVLVSSTNEIPIEVDLIQEKGKWKIYGLDLYHIETTVPRLEKPPPK